MITICGEEIKQERFPDGTLRLVLSEETKMYLSFWSHEQNKVTINWLYDSDSELFTLYSIVDILRRHGIENLYLNIPYLPHARMDRIKAPSENFSLKVFASMINNLNFKGVCSFNIHSHVGEALINNYNPTLINNSVTKALHQFEPTMIFFPDEGARKRYGDGTLFNTDAFTMAFGMKNRDWKSGEIKSYDILGDCPKDHKVLIIDDICSYGSTFFHAATKLKEQGATEVGLYVSHCENSVEKGELLKDNGLISVIFTTDSICTVNHPKITYVEKFRF